MTHGKNPSMVGSAVAGLIVKIVLASLVAWLLFHTRLDYNKSVTFIVVIGLILGIATTMPYVIWLIVTHNSCLPLRRGTKKDGLNRLVVRPLSREKRLSVWRKTITIAAAWEALIINV